jgi:hypothetical protein
MSKNSDGAEKSAQAVGRHEGRRPATLAGERRLQPLLVQPSHTGLGHL